MLIFTISNLKSAIITLINDTDSTVKITKLSKYQKSVGAEFKKIKPATPKILPQAKVILREEKSSKATNIKSFFLDLNKKNKKQIMAPNRADFYVELRVSEILKIDNNIIMQQGVYIQNIPENLQNSNFLDFNPTTKSSTSTTK